MADALRFVASSGLSRYEGAAISCGIKAAIGSWATDGANSPLAFKLRAELAALDVDFLEALSISPELPVDSNQDSCVFDRGWLSIKVRLHRIYQRTGVSNRTQLAAQSFAAEQTVAQKPLACDFCNIQLTLWDIFALLAAVYQLWGQTMRAGFGKLVTIALFFGCAMSVNPASAADLGLMSSGPGAVGSCSEIVFTCENGQAYPLCPIAVSVVGEVVTASLYTGRHRAMHVRMIPMGVGYRYAGRGIWLDGFRDNALLNFGKHSQVACTIQHS